MGRTQLIEEIKEYIGSYPHESVVDYINQSDNEELKFFLWRLENDWEHFYEGFINLRTRQIFTREQLLKTYQTQN